MPVFPLPVFPLPVCPLPVCPLPVFPLPVFPLHGPVQRIAQIEASCLPRPGRHGRRSPLSGKVARSAASSQPHRAGSVKLAR